MDWGQLAASIGEQLAFVVNAPVPFLAVALVMSWIIWHVVQREYATRLVNSASTIDLLSRQLQDYKDKTGSDTADEVKARIDALESRIEEMAPRRVRENQRLAMVPLLDPFSGHAVSISSDAASADSAQLSRGLAEAFHSAGWLVQTPMILGLGDPPRSGIGVGVPNPAQLTPPQIAITNALRAANLEFDLQSRNTGHRLGDQNRPQDVAQIILSNRIVD